MRHLSSIGLYEAAFGDASSRPASVSAHLEKCDRCSDATAELYELEIAFAAILPVASDSGECFSASELAEYLDGDSADKAAIKAHLDTCDGCFDSAAYYFTESGRMKSACGATASGVELQPEKIPVRAEVRAKHGGGWWSDINEWLVPFPAFATAVVLFVALVSTPPAPMIDVLRESSSFTVYQKQANALPYFYFGGEGKKIYSAPANMTVTSQRGRVTFDWTPVKGVKSYYFFLQETVDGAPSKIREIKDAVPPLSMPSEDFTPGAVYRWVTAGDIGDDRYFDGRLEFGISGDK